MEVFVFKLLFTKIGSFELFDIFLIQASRKLVGSLAEVRTPLVNGSGKHAPHTSTPTAIFWKWSNIAIFSLDRRTAFSIYLFVQR